MYQKNKKQLPDCFIDEALSLWSKYLTNPQDCNTSAFQEHCLKQKKTKTPFYLFYGCQVVAIHCTIRDIATFTRSNTFPRPLIDRLRNCLHFFNSSSIRAGYGQLFLYQTSIQEEFAAALKVDSHSKTHLATLLHIVTTLQSFTQEHINGNRFVAANTKFLQYLQKQEHDLAALLSLKKTPSPHTPPRPSPSSTGHTGQSPESSPGTTNLSCEDSYLSWGESENSAEKRGDTSSFGDSSSDSGSDCDHSPLPVRTLAEYSLFGDGPWADLHAKLREQLVALSPGLS